MKMMKTDDQTLEEDLNVRIDLTLGNVVTMEGVEDRNAINAAAMDIFLKYVDR